MIIEYICYKCGCDKCGHEWVTKTHDVPALCPRCKRVTWNEDSDAPQETPPPEPTPGKLSIDELRALMTGKSSVREPLRTQEPTIEWIVRRGGWNDQRGQFEYYEEHPETGKRRFVEYRDE